MAEHIDWSSGDIGFGIDIGGSGIKGAPTNLRTGELLTKRYRIPTPAQSTPDAVSDVLSQVLAHFEVPTDIEIGVAFPGIVQHNVLWSAVNLDQSWVGVDLAEVIQRHSGYRAHIVNDADAAGYAEVRYGAARGQDGTVLVLTLGTGIGSALIYDGVLVPNTELGHLEIDGYDAESRAASSVRDREGLSFEQWAQRLQRYFEVVEFLFSPDLFVIGGGVSKDHDQFLPLIDTRAPIVPAELRNKAGIAGAAVLATRIH